MQTVIYEVEKVELEVVDNELSTYLIRVTGSAPGGTWTFPRLLPAVYTTWPLDGILEFFFAAEAPDDEVSVGEENTFMMAEHEFSPRDPNFRGVRIRASHNAKVALINGQGEPGRKICVTGVLTGINGECQTLQGDNGQVYSLRGSNALLQVGDHIHVVGTVVESNRSMKGTAVTVDWVGKALLRSQAKPQFRIFERSL